MKSEELLRTIAKVLSFILQLDQNIWICFRNTEVVSIFSDGM